MEKNKIVLQHWGYNVLQEKNLEKDQELAE